MIEKKGQDEILFNEYKRQEREHNLKKPNMDLADRRVLKGGFVSI